ncbi:MAG TPA: LamG domain-containing protein [Kofleriaceae bacterium]|jgi:hypothetical protein|nr:LamG domain-containing protein [Kofleriaceae bacterium]
MTRIEQAPSRQARGRALRWCATVCMLAGCYRPASLACAVSCADGATCPSGLTCGATDRLCHAGGIECSASQPSSDATPDDAAPGSDGPLAYCDPGQPGLIGCYQFEGNARNAPGLPGPDIIVNAAVGFPADDEVGDAADFDGISSAFLPPDPSLELTAFTIETWAKPIFLVATGSTLVNHIGQYGLMLDGNGTPICSYHTTQGSSSLVTAPGINPLALHWNHLACTYDQKTLVLYVNGVAVAHTDSTAVVVTGLNLDTRIGGDVPDDQGDVYNGRLDELRIFDRARSAQQIYDDAGPACP